ncbi:hypothetical protein [Pseudoduganella violacea]|uniref:Uncharacterized protein n=1 Tax=Pseudoduganella violacea TaxID=1715466 RepID=A0A7W5BFL2_9BURK|nr:hypothetical protein [Pseudoduganella violacea]MBB3121395.1 hypothetical protein [Pseudoduganella violacea]
MARAGKGGELKTTFKKASSNLYLAWRPVFTLKGEASLPAMGAGASCLAMKESAMKTFLTNKPLFAALLLAALAGCGGSSDSGRYGNPAAGAQLRQPMRPACRIQRNLPDAGTDRRALRRQSRFCVERSAARRHLFQQSAGPARGGTENLVSGCRRQQSAARRVCEQGNDARHGF